MAILIWAMFVMSYRRMFFLFLIFQLPWFDHDLLIFGSQVDRFPDGEGIIKLLDIVSSDILFSSSREVSLHDIWERIHEDIEGLTIFLSYMVSFFLRWLLDKCDDLTRIPRTIEGELIPSRELHDDIRHPEECCPPRSRPYLYSLDLLIGNIEDIRGEPPPLHIDDCPLRRDPDIDIPIEELIHEECVDPHDIDMGIEFVMESRPQSKEIIPIEKKGDNEPKQCPEKNILDNDEYMPVKYFLYLSISADIPTEKKNIKIIHEYHYRGVDDSGWSLRKMPQWR